MSISIIFYTAKISQISELTKLFRWFNAYLTFDLETYFSLAEVSKRQLIFNHLTDFVAILA